MEGMTIGEDRTSQALIQYRNIIIAKDGLSPAKQLYAYTSSNY